MASPVRRMTGARDDVLVVGGGPAGLAVAAACAEAGMAVAVLADDPGRRWPQTFGVWADEVDPLGLPGTLADRWPTVAVHLGDDGPRHLARAYARIDNDRLQATLRTRAERAGARLVRGRAAAAEHDGAGTAVRVRDGGRRTCRVVVDASGHHPALVQRPPGRPPAYQTAYGVVVRGSVPAPAPSGMLLMDYRDPPGGPPDRPTFLYGMDLGGGRCLLEETALAARPAVDHGVLEARLRERLGCVGLAAEERVAVERVTIPMGGPLPRRDQRVVGFGAAAGMVHPATGYQVGAALARAPDLAAAIAAALDAPGATPAGVAAAGWRAVWPADLVRQRALHVLGLESLLRLGPGDTRAFFRAFFDLPQPRWRGFLSGERSAATLASTMMRLFAHAPGRVRGNLAATALTHPLARRRDRSR